MDTERLLTATRSARKSLDLKAPVDLDVIRDCLGVGLQAANGSNQQSWRWVIVTDEALRERIAALYRTTYLEKVGGQPDRRLPAEWLPRITVDVVDGVAGGASGRRADTRDPLL
jgi:nitroreductase